MKELKLTSKFKKDLKKYKHQHEKIKALEGVLMKLRNGETLIKNWNRIGLKGIIRATWSVMSALTFF